MKKQKLLSCVTVDNNFRDTQKHNMHTKNILRLTLNLKKIHYKNRNLNLGLLYNKIVSNITLFIA